MCSVGEGVERARRVTRCKRSRGWEKVWRADYVRKSGGQDGCSWHMARLVGEIWEMHLSCSGRSQIFDYDIVRRGTAHGNPLYV